jgi:hypothetical protein
MPFARKENELGLTFISFLAMNGQYLWMGLLKREIEIFANGVG